MPATSGSADKEDSKEDGRSPPAADGGKKLRASSAREASQREAAAAGERETAPSRASKHRPSPMNSGERNVQVKGESEDGDHDDADEYKGDDAEAFGGLLARAAGDVDANADSDFKIFPRRKGGQSKVRTESAPVIITAELLQTCFDMPLVRAAKKLGICATALKKVCRKLGIHKWPYKEMKPSLSLSRQIDDEGAGHGTPAAYGGAGSALGEATASAHRRDHNSGSLPQSARKSGSSGNGRESGEVSPPLVGRRGAHRGNRSSLRQAPGGGDGCEGDAAEGGQGDLAARAASSHPSSPLSVGGLRRGGHEFLAAGRSEGREGAEMSRVIALTKLQESLLAQGARGAQMLTHDLVSGGLLEGQRQLPSLLLASPPSSIKIPSMHAMQLPR
jgi:hypothetical protein